MAYAYYVTRLSENLGYTPEGSLVARDAVIARTGFQKYRGKELPQDEVAKLGLDIKPEDEVELYRSADEVFSAHTIGSFEGKPICEGHPGRFLAVEEIAPNGEDKGFFAIKDYQKGHVQNVRRGDEALESGEYALLADLVVTDPNLIMKIEGGLRELSCGYNYHLALDGTRLLQVDICGNHVAVVRAGRAGSEARIYDAAPEAPAVAVEVVSEITEPVAATPPSEGIGSPDKAASVETEKTTKGTYKVTNIFKHLLGLGLKAYAADADPEKLSEAVEAVQQQSAKPEPTILRPAARATDAAAVEEKTEEKKEAAKATDSDENDPRARMHGALDRMMDKRAKDAEDADVEELKKLMAEGDDPEATDAEEDKTEEESEEAEDEKAEEEGESEEAEGRDSADFIEPVSMGDEKRTAAVRKPQGLDTAQMLRELRPLAARSKDLKFRKWFNTQTARANDALRSGKGTGTGSYKKFQTAARTVDTRAGTGMDQGGDPEAQECSRLNSEYAKRFGKPISKEVM
jgi:hypothetical protein